MLQGVKMKRKINIIFLHHSTGNNVWQGGVPEWIADYNTKNNTSYFITESAFPKKVPYGWKNYPFDYYNIWVKNSGNLSYLEEPTLEMLTSEYNVICFKHCFPVSRVNVDTGNPDIESEEKTLENYKLQYNAIKEKLHQFPDTKFILWTGAALVKAQTTEEEAIRANEFFTWVKEHWNEQKDNIYLWDFRELETGGGLYLKDENAFNSNDSHLNPRFAEKVSPLFCNRLINIIENRGDETNLTGE